MKQNKTIKNKIKQKIQNKIIQNNIKQNNKIKQDKMK